jgi:NAD(P)-dependent dehydrogenase (short-subunit alcohol dehydrogenase family)
MTPNDASAKIALITGANKGIGKEIARGLGKKGYIVLVGSRDAKNGEATVSEFKKEDIQAYALPLEVTDEASIRSAARWVESKFGKLDALVNNAGILGDIGKPSEADLGAVKKVYDTNVFAPMRMTQVFLPLLKKSEAGRVVNVSSGLGSLTDVSDPNGPYFAINTLGYCTSKTALNAVTVHFAKELRDTPIKVNSACPGHCATDLNRHSGPRTPEQGAIAPIRLATLPADGPSGKFFNEDGSIEW